MITSTISTLNFFAQDEYIKLVSQFKLERAVEQELEALLTGFWEVRNTFTIAGSACIQLRLSATMFAYCSLVCFYIGQ